MFVYLWNYLKGYVIVEISGERIEKLLNGALNQGIYFWDAQSDGNKVVLKTSMDGFKELKAIVFRAKCRISILEKCGLPFINFKYRKRSVFIIGGVAFVAFFWFLTSFVWLVEIEGNDILEETDIIQTLREGGYTTGVLKSKLNLREAEQYLINQHNEILWTGISFQGTKLNVQITEAVPKPIIHNETEPTNIVATRDGIITYIATNSGTPLVKKGDTVKKGDILVTGVVTLESDLVIDAYYVNADAAIVARTPYTLEASLPLDKDQKVYLADYKTTYSIKLFDTQFNLGTKDEFTENIDTLVTINQLKLTSMFPLPFYWIRTDQVPYTKQITTRTETEIIDKLEGALNDNLLKKIGQTGKIIAKEMSYSTVDGVVYGVLNAIVEEDISIEQPINSEPQMSLASPQLS
ncbi:sporulation protein YqfD [Candidatus Epulonipiscium viviparus]|uniref:sporulation protein YqfD n=1 Tax=Candidatus Epulonipiscium viviparus TaxID=420336 RepID=UPI0027380C1D|nr:sporulation protein YqfD [Candidatus Epulopiscium viviparus]